jgi:xanthine/uracil/vitamin C permease (AzgA family)
LNYEPERVFITIRNPCKFFLIKKNNGTSLGTELSAGLSAFLAFICHCDQSGHFEPGRPSLRGSPDVPCLDYRHILVAAVLRSQTMTFQTALGRVFWAGLVFLLLLEFDRGHRLIKRVPRMLRFGMAGGIAP